MTWRKFGAGIVAAGALTSGGTVAIDQTVINPYTDKGSHYELKLKPDIDQGERVEIAKDRAAMTMKGWNDEYAITITPQIPSAPTFGAAAKIDKPFTTAANRPLLSKKMEFKSGDVTAFVEPVAGTENQFDIDFTLDAKPDTNVFEYKIDGADDFDFFYQPALSEEEIAQGFRQDDWQIASYIVVSKTKRNYCTNCGTPNYGTGTIGQFSRPKVIDAKGDWVWASLDYTDDTLSVIVPQEFLDKAKYPVTVDPTFGYTTCASGAQNSNVGTINASAFSIPEDGTIQSITACQRDFGSTFSGTSKANIYVESTLAPVSNGETPQISPGNISDTAQLVTFTYVTSPSLTSGISYFLAVWSSTGSGFQYTNRNTSGGNSTVQTIAYGSWPNPITDSGRTDLFQIYATYTAAASNSCTYSGSGDWNILGSDNCYVTGNIYVTGDCNLIGTGGLNLAGTISCNDIHAASGFSVRGKNNTARLYTRN